MKVSEHLPLIGKPTRHPRPHANLFMFPNKSRTTPAVFVTPSLNVSPSHFPHHTHVQVRYHSTHSIKSSFPQKQVKGRREQLSFFHPFAHFSCLATKKPNCFLSFSFAKTRPTRSLNWPVPRDWIQSLGGDAGAGLVTCPFATSPLALYHLD